MHIKKLILRNSHFLALNFFIFSFLTDKKLKLKKLILQNGYFLHQFFLLPHTSRIKKIDSSKCPFFASIFFTPSYFTNKKN